MIFSLLATSEAFGAVHLALGLADATVMGVASTGISSAFTKDPDPKDELNMAQEACRQYRWNLHKAKQMLSLAQTLNKDVGFLTAFSTEILDKIAAENTRMKQQIETWEREFKSQLFVSIAGSVGVVLIFVIIAFGQGLNLRSKLSFIRSEEHAHGY